MSQMTKVGMHAKLNTVDFSSLWTLRYIVSISLTFISGSDRIVAQTGLWLISLVVDSITYNHLGSIEL